jgi:hypothetical protein
MHLLLVKKTTQLEKEIEVPKVEGHFEGKKLRYY